MSGKTIDFTDRDLRVTEEALKGLKRHIKKDDWWKERPNAKQAMLADIKAVRIKIKPKVME